MKKFLVSLIGLSGLLLSSCGGVHHSVEEYKKELEYHDNFKIMQLTDIHFGIEMDHQKELKHLKNVIESAPEADLIVITGDSFLDADKKCVDTLVSFIDSFNKPWAFTYGNHDFQGDYDSFYIADQIRKAKNSVFVDYDDDDLHGFTNYFINLKENNKTKYRLYIIDSNSYAPVGIKYGYDIIHEEQLKHVEDIYMSDPAPALAFFHIPLVEYQTAYNLYEKGEIEGQGKNNEACCPGYTDTNRAFNRLKNSGVLATFVGHDHVNYSDLKYNNMILSYGVKATDLVYHEEEILGSKIITLPKEVSEFGLNSIESRFVKYEK